MSPLEKIDKYRFKLDKKNNTCGCAPNAKTGRCGCTMHSKDCVLLPLLHPLGLATTVASDDAVEDRGTSEYGSRAGDGMLHVKLPHVDSSKSSCAPSLVSKKQKHRRQNSNKRDRPRRSSQASSERKLCRGSCPEADDRISRCLSSCVRLPAIQDLGQKNVRCSPEKNSTSNAPRLPDSLLGQLPCGEKTAQRPAADKAKKIHGRSIAARSMAPNLALSDGSKSDRQVPHMTDSGAEPSREHRALCAQALLLPLRGPISHAHAHLFVKKR